MFGFNLMNIITKRFIQPYHIQIVIVDMFLQKQIFEWLKSCSVNQIKHILTIKQPNSLQYIKRLLTTQQECKPIERINHGYSETKIINEVSIYKRQSFRYKEKKDKKKEIDKQFFENITVSRVNPWSFSVKKKFIANGKLSECMMLLSDGQIFNFYKYLHRKLGSFNESIWFKNNSISSFSQWVTRLFELEIFEIYHNQKSIIHTTFLTFAENKINLEYVQSTLKSILASFMDKNSKLSKNYQKQKEIIVPMSKQQSEFLLRQCLNRFDEEGRDIGQIILEYEWISGQKESKVYRILQQLCQILLGRYSQYLIDLKAQEIQEAMSSKKKKKKYKKGKQEKEEKQINALQQPQVEKKQIQIQHINFAEQIKEQRKIQEKLNQQEKQEIKLMDNEKSPIQVKQLPKLIKNISKNTNKKSLSQNHKIELAISLQKKQQQQRKKLQKITNQRINQNIYSFYQQLHQASQNIDKYRKICIQIINLTIQEMKIPAKWRLQLFGSATIDFALKQSDLDLVLIIEAENGCSLTDIYQLFKARQWLRKCNVIQTTRVPIVEFQILLSQIKHPKLKDYKKLPNNIIHVDISIACGSQSHQGVKNTLFLKQIFEAQPNLKIVCLILKQLLRVHELNKPYKGGIGSYVLVILIHNILKMKKIVLDVNYDDQFIGITNFLLSQFIPYFTLITPYSHSEVKIDPELSFNIEDPQSNSLINTNIRLINEILALFKQLRQTFVEMRSEVMTANAQERKKMKKIFFKHWNDIFRINQQLNWQK